MNITLRLSHTPERYSHVCMATIPEGWEGETAALTFGGNTELAGEPIRIRGNTRREVIDRVIGELKDRNLHGTLKVIG